MKLLLLALAKPVLALGGFAGFFGYRNIPQPVDDFPPRVEEIVPAPRDKVDVQIEVVPAIEEVNPDEEPAERQPERSC